jgi:L-lactate dehydrogenase complex protein LldG
MRLEPGARTTVVGAMGDRAEFLANVRNLIGHDEGATVVPPDATGLSVSHTDAVAEAEQARAIAAERSGELFDAAAEAAETAGWTVHRLSATGEIANRVLRICRERNIETVLTSSHDVLGRAGVEDVLNAVGISAEVLRRGDVGTKAAAFSAGAGISGADWFIAESGTLVLHPRAGLSRLLTLAPPIHIAILEPGQVLPSLDELFAIERAAQIDGSLASSVNLISGPSRTGDIEATIVEGIHGPIETHLIMVG